MYQALYRKWRPQTFDQVVGQKHITETLKNQVMTGRLSHAYIFIGTRGTGKTTCARILARAVNCEHPVNGSPCGVCPACRGIADGSILDVVELDAASNNGVDNVRALRDEAVVSPAAVKKRVYIIDEVHMLSTPAFNALLKILEEPPEHLMFILATTELQKVPATILSRCQRHSFKRLDSSVIAEYLEYIASQEHMKLTHEAAEIIARLADGGVRDALTLLDQCSASENIDVEAVYSAMGLAGNLRIAELLDNIIGGNTAAALKSFDALWMDGKDPATLLGELNGLMRDVLMTQVAPKGGANLLSGGYSAAQLAQFAQSMTREELLCAMDTVQGAAAQMRDGRNPKLAAELCLVSLCDNTLGENIPALRARISRLEERVKNGVVGVIDSAPSRAPIVAPEPVREPEPERRDYPEYSDYDAPPIPGDELDPAQFAEEQPEDSFLRGRETAKPEPPRAPERAPVSAPAPAASDGKLWSAVCAAVMDKMPFDVRGYLVDESKVCAAVDGDVLRVEVVPGFVYGRVNKPDIIQRFSDAARSISGREMRVLLTELKPKPRQQRSLEELKQFKEVKFI